MKIKSIAKILNKLVDDGNGDWSMEIITPYGSVANIVFVLSDFDAEEKRVIFSADEKVINHEKYHNSN